MRKIDINKWPGIGFLQIIPRTNMMEEIRKSSMFYETSGDTKE